MVLDALDERGHSRIGGPREPLDAVAIGADGGDARAVGWVGARIEQRL
jgi:hypothetical protein